MSGPARSAVLLATLGLAVAACAPASATPSTLPSVGEPSEMTAACDPGVICDGPLAAGDYVSETTGARVEFTLDDHGWAGLADTEGDGFGLYLSDLAVAHGINVVAFSGEYFTDACDPNAGTTTGGTTPAEFMAMLAARDGVTASAPVELVVGGQPGLQVDFTTALPAGCGANGPPWIWLWTLPVHGDFHFDDRETGTLAAIDAGSATVIIVVEAWPDVTDEDWEHLTEHAAEVIETMTIAPLD